MGGTVSLWVYERIFATKEIFCNFKNLGLDEEYITMLVRENILAAMNAIKLSYADSKAHFFK